MKIDVRLDPTSEREFKRAMEEYAKLLGTGIEEVIDETAAETAKRIAARTQPFGIGEPKNRAFQKSIAKQIHRALWWGMRHGETGGMSAIREAHQKRRNNKGQVYKGRKPMKEQWLDKGFPPQERHAYVDKMMQRAGMEKASWLDAGVKAWSKLVIPSYWKPKLKLGYAIKTGEGMKRSVTIGTNANYTTLKTAAFKAALKNGRKTMIGKMQRVLKKAEAKTNRQFKASQAKMQKAYAKLES
jgi:hypothetical protein